MKTTIITYSCDICKQQASVNIAIGILTNKENLKLRYVVTGDDICTAEIHICGICQRMIIRHHETGAITNE